MKMAIVFQSAFDWLAAFRQVGVTGVVCLFFGLIIWKVFIPMMRATVDDARKERDYMRQRRDEEVDKFSESLKSQGEVFKSALQDILRNPDRRP